MATFPDGTDPWVMHLTETLLMVYGRTFTTSGKTLHSPLAINKWIELLARRDDFYDAFAPLNGAWPIMRGNAKVVVADCCAHCGVTWDEIEGSGKNKTAQKKQFNELRDPPDLRSGRLCRLCSQHKRRMRQARDDETMPKLREGNTFYERTYCTRKTLLPIPTEIVFRCNSVALISEKVRLTSKCNMHSTVNASTDQVKMHSP